MATTWRPCVLAALAISTLVASVGRSGAQPVDDQPSADIAPPPYAVRLEGEVRLTREGQDDELEVGLPLEDGDRLSTGLGRLEWRRDGAEAIFLDRYTDVEVFGPELLRVRAGTVMITLPPDASTTPYRFDTEAGSVRLSWPGRYRVTVQGDAAETEMEVTTLRGAAVVEAGTIRQPVGPGERAWVRVGEQPSAPAAINVAVADAFDRWADATPVDERRAEPASAMPPSLAGYAPVLSQHGSWQSDATYGRVWYPNTIPGWRPYVNGRWRRAPRLGYVWMGMEPWSWPTHHYGRWELTRGGRWFWIPTPGWSAAHVYWAVAPGYVAWSPLGWSGRPLVDFGVGLGYNRGGSYFGVRGGLASAAPDPWSVWTVIPSTSFGYARSVAGLQLGRSYFRGQDRSAFVMSRRLPASSWSSPRLARRPFQGRGAPADGRSSDGRPFQPGDPRVRPLPGERPRPSSRSGPAVPRTFAAPRSPEDRVPPRSPEDRVPPTYRVPSRVGSGTGRGDDSSHRVDAGIPRRRRYPNDTDGRSQSDIGTYFIPGAPAGNRRSPAPTTPDQAMPRQPRGERFSTGRPADGVAATPGFVIRTPPPRREAPGGAIASPPASAQPSRSPFGRGPAPSVGGPSPMRNRGAVATPGGSVSGVREGSQAVSRESAARPDRP